MNIFTYPIADKSDLITKLAKMGLTIDPNAESGQLPPYDGVVLDWAIAGNNVNLSVVSKPFYVGIGVIKSHLDSFFGAA